MTRLFIFALLAGGLALAQQTAVDEPKLNTREEPPPATPVPGQKRFVVPAGTKVPVALKQPISTKGAQPGDPIYGQTTFPIVTAGQVMIPAGTYVQGVVDHVKRAGRIRGTAELQFHLTTLIYPNGYTVDMNAAIDQVPGAEDSHMKEPGVIRHDSEKGKDLERVGHGASEGAMIGTAAGALAGSLHSLGVGGISGIAAGTLIAMLTRGTDVRFETGTVVDVTLSHGIVVDRDQVTRPAM